MSPLQYLKNIYRQVFGTSSESIDTIGDDALLIKFNLENFDKNVISELKDKLLVHPWVSPTYPVKVTFIQGQATLSVRAISEAKKLQIVRYIEQEVSR